MTAHFGRLAGVPVLGDRSPMADDTGELEGLLTRVAAGDRPAFRKLFDRVSGLVYGTTRRILRDRSLADDAAQAAFLKIWRMAGRFDAARGRAVHWIAVIARRAALDLVDIAQHTEPLETVEIGVDPASVSDPGVRRCLETLNPEHRNALLLAYVYGMTHEELADALGAPLGTVKSRVRRAAAAMRECLGP